MLAMMPPAGLSGHLIFLGGRVDLPDPGSTPRANGEGSPVLADAAEET
jgi:hypothetical protein